MDDCLIAQLNERWRVVDTAEGWRLEMRASDLSVPGAREWLPVARRLGRADLLSDAVKFSGPIDPDAIAILKRLPLRHPSPPEKKDPQAESPRHGKGRLSEGRHG